MNERIIISPTIWLPVLLILLTLAVVGGVKWAGGDDTPTHTVADDCYSDLVVKQQTGQIGRYGNVNGMGENAPLTRGVLKSICEDAWSIDGPQKSPHPFTCPEGLRLTYLGGTPQPDPDCATPLPTCDFSLVPLNSPCTGNGDTPSPTIDASPTVPTPTCPPWSASLVCMPTPTPYHTLNCASPPQGYSVCFMTPTPTAATLPETGGRP